MHMLRALGVLVWLMHMCHPSCMCSDHPILMVSDTAVSVSDMVIGYSMRHMRCEIFVTSGHAHVSFWSILVSSSSTRVTPS